MELHDLAREIFVQAALAVLSGAGIRAERLLIVEKEQHRRMLLDRLDHVCEASEHIGPDRLALERAGPHPRQFALVGGDAEMVGPERHQPLEETAFGDHRALQPRQGLGAVGLLDDVERRLRRRLCSVGLHRVGLHGARLHRVVGLHRRVGVFRRLRRGVFSGDVHRDGVERKIARWRLGLRCALRRRGLRCRRAGLRCRGARLLHLQLISEHRVGQGRGRLQSAHLQQHTVGAVQFGFDKTTRIGRRIDEIARGAAAPAKSEAIERDKCGLRIAGHRMSLCAFPGLSGAYICVAQYTAVSDEPHIKNARAMQSRT
jgi:hypothetical protein